MDNALNDPQLAQLASLSRAIVELRSALARVEDSRDALIRRLDGAATNRTLIADVAGLTRGRVWQIINPTYRGELDEDAEPDFELLEFADRLWEHAVDQWMESGREGSPDDYFPIDATLTP